MPDLPERRKVGTIERHVQTILISIITGAILFVANYVFNDSKEKAVQGTQLEVLTRQVIEMRADIRSLQTDYASRTEVRALDERVRKLENRK